MDSIEKKVSFSNGWACFRNTLRAAMDVRMVEWHPGPMQCSGALTVIPLFGPELSGFIAPGAGVRLHRVHTYGDVELACPKEAKQSAEDLAIVPLHMGFIQHGAQNHALCGSALIEPGHTVRFTDACCVQAAQGGLLEGREQWFFVLPLALRNEALRMQGQKGYNKLWTAIAKLNSAFGLPERGHLEQLLSRERAYLTQYRSRFECAEDQIGALFFVNSRLVGIEIAPNAAYFRDLWMPLVSFAYGIAAYHSERSHGSIYGEALPFDGVTNRTDLRLRLQTSRASDEAIVGEALSRAATGWTSVRRKVTARHDPTNTILQTIHTAGFAGQVVQRAGRIAYLSCFSVG